jgi:glyoxylase-like metal-dependent hydrolase (beta-lactamase superfamily II)
MFNVQRIECNPLQENCYVVSDDSRECVIIDCGAMYEEELAALDHYIADNQLKPLHLLATHGHLDHNFGNSTIFNEFGLKVEVCSEDGYLIEDLPKQATDLFGIDINHDQPEVGRWLKDGDTITFGTHTLKVLQTPGHTPGSALIYCEEEHTCFTGDTLFRMSIGRTDFDGGSWEQMEQSLSNVVANLPKETIVLSGHGPQSTIEEELKYNPYLRH